MCSGCGRRTSRVRDTKVRTWDDLPWAEHPVTLRYGLRRLWCGHCGIRTERDLLEAIVFPSASFVRSYESVRVVTTDERTFNGILKKDAPDEIIVVVAADKEERVARADVASITPSAVSVMPSGLDQQLSPQDLADLVAFLRACK